MEEFYQNVVLVVLDGLIVGVLVLGVGYVANRRLAGFQQQLNRQSSLDEEIRAGIRELTKDRRTRELDRVERQLSEFWWPLHMRISLDTQIWRSIKHLSPSTGTLPESIGVEVEREVLLPNHRAAVALIQEKAHLIIDGTDPESNTMRDLLLEYVRHVAVLEALRKSSQPNANPIVLQADWPEDLATRIEERLNEVLARRQELLSAAAR